MSSAVISSIFAVFSTLVFTVFDADSDAKREFHHEGFEAHEGRKEVKTLASFATWREISFSLFELFDVEYPALLKLRRTAEDDYSLGPLVAAVRLRWVLRGVQVRDGTPAHQNQGRGCNRTVMV